MVNSAEVHASESASVACVSGFALARPPPLQLSPKPGSSSKTSRQGGGGGGSRSLRFKTPVSGSALPSLLVEAWSDALEAAETHRRNVTRDNDVEQRRAIKHQQKQKTIGGEEGEKQRQLRRASLFAPPPPAGLRQCVVCGASLSTPLRMEAHLAGKRHALAVARRFLLSRVHEADGEGSEDQCKSGVTINGGMGCGDARAASREMSDVSGTEEAWRFLGSILEIHSDAPLAASAAALAEPPDVALGELSAARAWIMKVGAREK